MILKEDYGESEELNTFVSQANDRFSKYYIVTLTLKNSTSKKYFAYQEAAQKYYDGLFDEANNNKSYYSGAKIELDSVEVNIDTEELDSATIYDDEYEDDESVFDFEDEDQDIDELGEITDLSDDIEDNEE